VNDNHRDGFHQQAVHQGRTPYLPNAVGGGCPFLADVDDGGYVHVPRPVGGVKERTREPDDEYGQATLFWNSMTEIEQDHLVDAFTFELGKVDVPAVVERMLLRLVHVDGQLAARVGRGLGITVDAGRSTANGDESPALSMVTENVYPPDGRVVHLLASDGADLVGVAALKDALLVVGVAAHVIAPHKGVLTDGAAEVTVDRSFHTASSAEADAVVLASGASFATDPVVATYVQSAYRHFKTIGAWGDGRAVLDALAIATDVDGVLVADEGPDLGEAIVTALGRHRHWERAAVHPTRDAEGD